MIQGKAIVDLVNLLEARQVYFYHACQLQDLRSYLRIRGIPSRSLLTQEKRSFTAFETDQQDRKKRVWDKVFVNLVDFGEWFADGRGVIPNPYGPILLLISPRAVLHAKSVAVCLRSAGAADFNRRREALGIDDIDRLFEYPANSALPRSARLKDRSTIRRDFAIPDAQLPEISISMPDDRIQYRYVNRIIVDPYHIGSRSLKFWVTNLLTIARVKTPIATRECTNQNLYRELGKFILASGSYFHVLWQSTDVSQELRLWSRQIVENKLEWQYNRYARYLREGTLLPLTERAAQYSRRA